MYIGLWGSVSVCRGAENFVKEVPYVTIDDVLWEFVVFKEFYQKVNFGVGRSPVRGKVVASIEESLYGINFEHLGHEGDIVNTEAAIAGFPVNRCGDVVAVSGQKDVKEWECSIFFMFNSEFNVLVFVVEIGLEFGYVFRVSEKEEAIVHISFVIQWLEV